MDSAARVPGHALAATLTSSKNERIAELVGSAAVVNSKTHRTAPAVEKSISASCALVVRGRQRTRTDGADSSHAMI